MELNVGNNLRHELLGSWTYPGLENSDLKTVDELQNLGWYGGRVTSVGSQFDGRGDREIQLGWGEKSLKFRVQGVAFTPERYDEVMAVGDLVRLHVTQTKPLQVDRLHLLVPCRSKLSDFKISRTRQWNAFVETVRTYFKSLNFEEMRTPSLVVCPGTEAYLRPFEVGIRLGSKTVGRYLPTSPELHLKKYLVRGHSRIFELKECFRNEEMTEHHRPEFMMLEWYRAFSNLESIVGDLKGLIGSLCARFAVTAPEVRVVSVRELFKKFLDFELTPLTDVSDLRELLTKCRVQWDGSDTWDELFFRVFIEKIELPLMSESQREVAWIVRDYPPRLAAYSRILPSGWADRFELYWKGMELANAFHELNDPEVQRTRMTEDNLRKQKLGLTPVPLDEDFLSTLAYGLPPSGGIALGMERLFMALFDVRDIGEISPFGFGE